MSDGSDNNPKDKPADPPQAEDQLEESWFADGGEQPTSPAPAPVEVGAEDATPAAPSVPEEVTAPMAAPAAAPFESASTDLIDVATSPLASDAPVSDAPAPDVQAADSQAADAPVADSQAPEAQTPDAPAPDASAPDVQAPDAPAPDGQATGTPAPDGQAIGTPALDNVDPLATIRDTPFPSAPPPVVAVSEGPVDAEILVDDSAMSDDAVTSGVIHVSPSSAPPASPVEEPLPAIEHASIPVEPSAEEIESATARIDLCVREAQAFGQTPQAAPLWFEAGQLYEEVLRNPRQAATSYQAAFQNDQTFLPVIHAARRLFADIGNWGMVGQLLGAEVQVISETGRRAPLLVEQGHILETKLDKEDEALSAYREALQAEPNYGPAYDALARRLRGAERYQELVETGIPLLDHLPAGDQRDERTLELARLLEARLDDHARSLELLRRVLKDSPGQREAAVSQIRLLRRMGRDAELVEALVHRSGQVTGGQRAALLVEAARLCRSRLKDRLKARELLERAKIAAPKSLLVLRDLGDLLSVSGEHEALADVLLEQAACVADPSERVALHAELGRLYEERLQLEERSVEQFQRVVELDPSYQPAVVSLGRLYFHQGRFEDLVRLYEREIEHLEDPAQKISRLFKVAELLQHKLDDAEGALASYEAILELDPIYVPAQKAMAALLTSGERWEQLVAMYQRELEHTQDKDQQIFLLDRIGTLQEEKLDQVELAIEAHERVLSLSPGYLPAIRSLSKLYGRAERYADLIRVNDQEAQALQDPMQVVALLFRNGEIYEEHLEDKDKAIEIYRKVIGLNPAYLPALQALGRLYHQRELYDDLIDMYRQEAEVARATAHRASLLFKIAELYEEKLGDMSKALNAYRDVLKEIPSFHPALRAVARILLSQDDDRGLAEIAKVECEVLGNPKERAISKCRAGLVLEVHLQDEQAAVDTYRSALDDDPGLFDAQAALVRISRRQGDLETEIAALRQAIEHSDDEDVAALWIRELADLFAFRADRTPEAMELYGKLLERAGDDREVLRGALRCALSQRDYAHAIELAEQLAPLESDPDQAATLYLQVGGWRASHVDPPQDPTAAYLKALEYAPTEPVALRAVERAYLQVDFQSGLYELYKRERASAESPAHRHFLDVRMADLAAGQLGRPDEAIALLEQTVQEDPKSTVALRRLKQLYQASDRPADQLRVLALEADASPDPQAAITNLMEVGRLQEEQATDQGAAVDCYMKVLSRDAGNNEAFARADRLLNALERWSELAQLYRQRAGVTSGGEAKVSLLMRAAHVEAHQLENPIAALASFHEVLNLNAAFVPALVSVGDLEIKLEHWTEAAQAYEKVISATSDPNVTAPILRRLGAIYRDHLEDPQRAIQAFTASLAQQPNDADVLGHLGGLYISAQSWAEASDVLAKRLVFVTDNEVKLDTLYKLAQVYEVGLGNQPQAAAFLEQALALDPAASGTVNRLAELYKRTGNWAALAATLSRLAQSLPVEQRAAAGPLYRELGTLYEQQLGQPSNAVEAYNAALAVDPADVACRTRLAMVYASNPATHKQAVDEYRTLLRHAPLEANALRALRQIFQADKRHDAAFVMCELLNLLHAANDDEIFYYDDNRAKVPQHTDHTLTAEEHEALILHPDERGPLHQLLRVCSSELSKVYPPNLDSYHVTRADRLTAKSDNPLRTLADSIANALSGASFDVYRCKSKGLALAVENTDPPSLIIGPEVIRRHPNREQRFLIGSLVEGLLSGHHLVDRMDVASFATFVTAVGQAVDSSFAPLEGARPLEDLGKRISRALSRGAKKSLVDVVGRLDRQRGEIDLARFLQALPLSKLRAGLALSNDFESALRLIARNVGANYNLNDLPGLSAIVTQQPPLLELFTFAVSDEYFSARRSLHFAIDA